MRAFQIVATGMTLLFIVSAAVQYNDPDPWVWITIYGVAAILSGGGALGRTPLLPNALALAVFATLTALWLPSLAGARPEAFSEFRMIDRADEEPREAVGLAICTVWIAAQTLRGWRRPGVTT